MGKISKRNLSKIILLVSLAFVVYGARRDEVDTVFSKAINLCLECIGIG